ncbi:MAG: hypothetical protein ACHQ02_02410, partial [Candidatus Limnocylindrales bacterium]
MAPAPGAAPDDQSTVPTAVILAPGGQAVDGRRLVGEAVGFGRALRAGGLAVDLGAAIDFSRALTLVDVGDREQVRAAGEAVFVRRRDDRIVYDRIFERWWRRRAARLPSDGPALPPLEDEGLDAGADGTDTGAADDDHAAGEPLGQLLAAAVMRSNSRCRSASAVEKASGAMTVRSGVTASSPSSPAAASSWPRGSPAAW